MNQKINNSAVAYLVIAVVWGMILGGAITWAVTLSDRGPRGWNWVLFGVLWLVLGLAVSVLLGAAQNSSNISREEEERPNPQPLPLREGWHKDAPRRNCGAYLTVRLQCRSCPYLYAAGSDLARQAPACRRWVN